MRVSENRGTDAEIRDRIRQRYKGIDKDELEIIPAIPEPKLSDDKRHKRVAVYARVSTDSLDQESSFELQRNHYLEMVNDHENWDLVDIYADQGISGTSLAHRENFQRMIRDCEAGKIDLVITKSVSRFARNIVDCIAEQRKLASLPHPVNVFFESEHLDSMGQNSEMMMSVLATVAQEESHTKSMTMNSSIEWRFSKGIFLTPKLLGYDLDEDGNLIINKEEAKTVRLCYYMLIAGYSLTSIAECLTELGRETKLGNTEWSSSSVRDIILNERHCGDVLARKTWTPNYLNHKSKQNRGNRNQYRMRDHHEAIASHEIYDAAVKILECRKFTQDSYPLPTLDVIEDGVLKGFVSVNRSWTGFSSGDYQLASQSVYEDAPAGSEDSSRPDSVFDFSGYQVVRAQLFSTKEKPKLTINNGKLSFNADCIKRFDGVEFVELLVNTVERCLAIRPSDVSNPNAIRWATLRSGKWQALPKSCRGFEDVLYGLMEYEDARKLCLYGSYDEMGGEQVIIFNLKEPELYIEQLDETGGDDPAGDLACPDEAENADEPAADDQTEAAPDKKKITLIPVYPDSWQNSFGRNAGENEFVFLTEAKYKGDWDVMRPAIMIKGLEDLTKEAINKVAKEAEQLFAEMSQERMNNDG